ncbi:MAG: HEAT repeat domain-containing protein, partial [FCB group bacterium]|nr:HEAT repeat domain-containing protein [FCB group bacterium]
MTKFIRKLGFIAVVVLLALVAYYLYDNLRERTYTEKIAEIIHDEGTRVFSPQLKKYLTDINPKVRERAALAVGRIGAKGSGKLLFDLVNSDSSLNVAATAAFALGLTHEKKYALPLLDVALDYSLKENPKLKDLTKVESKIKLNSKMSVMAVKGASLLLDSSMVDAIDMLDGFLNHISPEVRQATCLAYARGEAKNKGKVLMNFIAREKDKDVKISALYALVHLSVKEAQNIYYDYFSETDPFVRILSVQGLGLLDTPEQVHELTIALNDNNDKVVLQAVK